jgi:hypothetical protein
MKIRTVPHNRKPKGKTADERRHHDRVAAMGCLVCGGPANIHHVTSDGFQRLRRDHMRVVPLCAQCHQHGPGAVHVIGHATFCALHGDLIELADRLANADHV